jgi:hypothetical protein
MIVPFVAVNIIFRRPIIGKPKKMTLEYDAAEEGDEV